ncbi:hypothetical protein [Pseudoxanthomonas jiangsuensis]|uniref:hypothetical protein n=1 Tax=Pseudoxanthomonas jiangsuensis TaxID=619688 RepID=UPI001391D09B|nr:hypothetical protein [Pseudoxanthomonas jiangsuensis]
MSTQQPPARPLRRARACPPRQSGIGLVQVMLILLLVAATLGAAAVLLQSRTEPTQAVTQEQSLRWADEAITAFAAANSRLPCPAQVANGYEDCDPDHARGWLPWRSLVGATGNGPQVGPMAYMVYRGDADNHLDLAATGNAYQPAGLDGNSREIVVTKGTGTDPDVTREFAAINGLDLCRTLALAIDASPDADLSSVQARTGLPVNVAYGIAAAGPRAGSASRLDDGNATGNLEAPWREWSSGYDDRVRIRSFDAVGQMLGCRQLAIGTGNTSAAAAAAPFAAAAASTVAGTSGYDVSLAAMDMLAAAVTMHDTLASLQENNVGNTNASVTAAAFAQAVSIAAIVLAAGQVTDAVSTMVTAATSLVRAVATCIASLGATCAEVPLKATALGLSIGSVATNAVALGLKAGALIPTAMALAETIDARDRAAKAAEEKPADLKSAIDEMACKLYGIDPPDLGYNPCKNESKVKIGSDGLPVKKLDAQGYPIPKRDADGRQLFDTNGVPLYEYEYEADSDPPGLDDKRDDAKAQWEALQHHSALLLDNRITPWDNDHIKDRIQPDSYNLDQSGGRYRKEVIDVFCDNVGANNGEYDLQSGSCVHVGSSEVTSPDGTKSTVKNGAYDRREEKRYEFDWDKAIAEAIVKRTLAEQWAKGSLRVGEIDREIEELQDNWDQWFVGTSQVEAILTGMKKERDEHCALPQGDQINKQKCDNAKEGVTYVETCIRSDGIDQATGNKIMVEDTRPEASCKPRMAEKLAATKAEKQASVDARDGAATAYGSAPAPIMRYPSAWFHQAIEIIEDADGNPIRYDWLTSTRKEPYLYWNAALDPPAYENRERTLPYYAPEPYNGFGAPPLLVTSSLEIYNKELCQFFNGTWNLGWGDAYRHGIYCQRYPYSRAYEDWIRAQEATDAAKKTYDDLRREFDNLEREYNALRNTALAGPDGAVTSPVSFGAEAALERADARGSVGPRPVEATTP